MSWPERNPTSRNLTFHFVIFHFKASFRITSPFPISSPINHPQCHPVPLCWGNNPVLDVNLTVRNQILHASKVQPICFVFYGLFGRTWRVANQAINRRRMLSWQSIKSIDQASKQSSNQSAKQPTKQSANQPAHQSINQSINLVNGFPAHFISCFCWLFSGHSGFCYYRIILSPWNSSKTWNSRPSPVISLPWKTNTDWTPGVCKGPFVPMA